MATPRPFQLAKLIFGVLSVDHSLHQRLFEMVETSFGPIESVTDAVPFDYTAYYDEEMGAHPVRFFIVSKNLIDPKRLAECKIRTNGIEAEFSVEGKRRINLDPGILSAHNLILATTKDRSHRIPLSDGIYGEVTLMYRDKGFCGFPWTYADYASEPFKAFFASLRTSYMKQLKQ